MANRDAIDTAIASLYQVANQIAMLRDLAQTHAYFLESAEAGLGSDGPRESLSSDAWDGIVDTLTTSHQRILDAVGQIEAGMTATETAVQ